MKKEEKKDKDENENLYHKEPSFFQMAKNFATSEVDYPRTGGLSPDTGPRN